jgi:hypothetical protein
MKKPCTIILLFLLFFCSPGDFQRALAQANDAAEAEDGSAGKHRALILDDGRSMRIGSRVYRVYLSSHPLTPSRGERILDSGGALDYYIWIYKADTGYFSTALIDGDLYVYYYDDTTKTFYNELTQKTLDPETGKTTKPE